MYPRIEDGVVMNAGAVCCWDHMSIGKDYIIGSNSVLFSLFQAMSL